MKFHVLEKDIQKAIIDQFEYRKAVVVKINNVGIRKANGSYIPPREVGVSDLIILYKGKYIALEVKAGKNKPTDNQLRFLERVRKSGGIAEWVSDVNEAIEIINHIDKGLL